MVSNYRTSNWKTTNVTKTTISGDIEEKVGHIISGNISSSRLLMD